MGSGWKAQISLRAGTGIAWMPPLGAQGDSAETRFLSQFLGLLQKERGQPQKIPPAVTQHTDCAQGHQSCGAPQARQLLSPAEPRAGKRSPVALGTPQGGEPQGRQGRTYWVCLADRHLLRESDFGRVGPELRLLGCADESRFGRLQREHWVNHLPALGATVWGKADTQRKPL